MHLFVISKSNKTMPPTNRQILLENKSSYKPYHKKYSNEALQKHCKFFLQTVFNILV